MQSNALKKISLRILKIISKSVAVLLLLLLLVVALINIPAVQTYVTQRITQVISSDYGVDVEVGGVMLAIPNTVQVRDVFVPGQDGDTLLFLGALKADVALLKLLNNHVEVKYFSLSNLKADVQRGPPGAGYNFDFLIEAFTSDSDTVSVADTTPSKPWQISIDHVEFENIDASFRDETTGMDAKLNLGNFNIYVDEIDFSNPDFLIDRILLEDTKIKYEEWAVNTGGDDDTKADDAEDLEAVGEAAPSLPGVGLNELALKNVQIDYMQHDSKLKMHLHAGDIRVEPGENDLNLQKLSVDQIFIGQTVAKIAITSDTLSSDTDEQNFQNQDEADFSLPYPFLPGWEITVAALDLDEVIFGFDDLAMPAVEQGMDYSHMLFEDVSLQVRDVTLADELAEVAINSLSLREKSGLTIDDLKLETRLTPESAALKGLALNVKDFELLADLKVEFGSLDEAFQNPEKLQTDVNLSIKNLSPATFQVITGPVLPDSSYSNLQNENINLDLRALGPLDSLEIGLLKLSALSQTKVIAEGSILNLSRPNEIFVDLKLDSLVTGRTDLLALSGGMIPENILLPDTITGSLQARGSMESARANLTLTTNFGDISSDLFYAASTPQDSDSVEVQLTINRLNIGKILQNEQLGEANLALNSNASGLEKGQIDAAVTATIFDTEFNDYIYDGLRIEANMQDSLVWLKMLSDDPNAKISMELETKLDSTIRDLELALKVDYLDLHPLNFADEKFVVETNMQLSGNYNSIDDLNGNLLFESTRLEQRDDIVPIKEIHFKPEFSSQGTFMEFSSGIVNFNFESNVPFSEFEPLLRSSLRQYLGLATEYEIDPDSRIHFSASINLNDDFRSYFVPDLNKILLDTIVGYYSGQNNQMGLQFQAPIVSYGNINVEDIKIDLAGIGDTITFETGFRKLFYDSLFVSNFQITERLRSGHLLSDISIAGDDNLANYRFLNKVRYTNDTLQFSFLDDGLILNGKQWSVIPGNELLIVDSAIISKDFNFSESDQNIAFTSNENAGNLTAENFQLRNLLAIFKSPRHEGIVKGLLDMDFEIPHTKQYEGIGLDLSINDLYVFDSLIGNIKINMEEKPNELEMEVRLDNKENWLHGSGTIDKADEEQAVNFDTKFEISDPARFEVLTQGLISDLSGVISGDMDIKGNLSQPELIGEIDFDETRLTVDQLNLQLYLPNEKVQFTKTGIEFSDFEIFDDNNSKLAIQGDLNITDPENPAFDLRIQSNNFQPVNSTRDDNNIFYGSLVMDADVSLKGDMLLPVVDADLSIKAGTDLTYVLPGSEIEIVSSEGVVNFINPVYDDDTLKQIAGSEYLTDSILSRFEGLDMNAKLDLNPEAKFTLVIDPYSGDYSSVQGSATMNYTMDPSGSQSLTGVFEVTKGIYQLSFYGLVKKTFEFEPGSSIAWSGRPLDANINFTAKHVVRTQSVALVANESTGMTEAEKNMFKQRLPYEVLLNLRGFLDEPDVSFRIELPEKYQVNYPQITSKLNMLNSGQNDSELNKQVFALLVSGSFIAENPFASSGGSAENFATTAARNSVNGILAQQLNNISNKYIKGVDMNFGLTTYEDYSGSSSDTRTELDVQVSKKLLDDRLTVEASGSFDVEGSRRYTGTNTSHTYGEFSATYDLTESREYKLRAYRENAYDLFEGEVAYSGIAFIIEKSFDQLFKRKNAEEKKQKVDDENSPGENEKREGKQ